ncbi:hypothetical protein SDC9_59715 [bioreactor metagenome]|uniref:Uncharacterized protein n=1 Tax=bioreactor metagenome TaxID=1076179 RepID=A0A644XC48_9ZZZZ
MQVLNRFNDETPGYSLAILTEMLLQLHYVKRLFLVDRFQRKKCAPARYRHRIHHIDIVQFSRRHHRVFITAGHSSAFCYMDNAIIFRQAFFEEFFIFSRICCSGLRQAFRLIVVFKQRFLLYIWVIKIVRCIHSHVGRNYFDFVMVSHFRRHIEGTVGRNADLIHFPYPFFGVKIMFVLNITECFRSIDPQCLN